MSDSAGVENVRIDTDDFTAEDTDICTEKWMISPTAIACVEMEVKV